MLVYSVDKAACSEFLENHKSVHESMKQFGRPTGNLMKRYCKWLDWKQKNESEFSDYSDTVDSHSFGSKTFYKVHWNGVSGWAELFQYVNG